MTAMPALDSLKRDLRDGVRALTGRPAFTAVAILQLVGAGEVQLDAPIGDYLTGYPNEEVATTVSIHHLLTHTGGTGDIFGPDFNAANGDGFVVRGFLLALNRMPGRVFGSRLGRLAAGT